jgi:hypothetical protein
MISYWAQYQYSPERGHPLVLRLREGRSLTETQKEALQQYVGAMQKGFQDHGDQAISQVKHDLNDRGAFKMESIKMTHSNPQFDGRYLEIYKRIPLLIHEIGEFLTSVQVQAAQPGLAKVGEKVFERLAEEQVSRTANPLGKPDETRKGKSEEEIKKAAAEAAKKAAKDTAKDEGR